MPEADTPLSLDFETRSRTDLIACGSYRYAECPSTRVISFAWKSQGEAPRFWTPLDADYPTDSPDDLFEHVANGGLVKAWNAEFELLIWNHLLAQHLPYEIPRLQIEQLRDGMAWAQALALPGKLDNAVKALDLPEWAHKDHRGGALIQKLCKPRRVSKTNPNGDLFHEYPMEQRTKTQRSLRQDFHAFFDYNKQDCVAEEAVCNVLRPLSDAEQAVWEMTLKINARGVPVSLSDASTMHGLCERYKAKLDEELREITDGAVESATSAGQIREFLGIDSVAKEEVENLLHTVRDPVSRRVLEIRRSGSRTNVAKLGKMDSLVCSDGTLKGMLTYHAASPGRYSSRGGMNLQNLTRPTHSDLVTALDCLLEDDLDLAEFLYGDVIEVASSCIRGVLCAPEGKRFVVSDFSSVEDRAGFWITKDVDTLDDFRNHVDRYKKMAVEMHPGSRYETITKDQRQEAKPVVLGCLFGQGKFGLVTYAAQFGVEMSEDRAEELVKLYREQNPSIPRMWYACGDAARNAVEAPGRAFLAGDYFLFKLSASGNFLMMRLPSGRMIAFPFPRIEEVSVPWGGTKESITCMVSDARTKQWIRKPLIPSSIFQSGVQGTARDLLVHSMRTVDPTYPVVLTVHDEIVSLVDEDRGSLDEFNALMSQGPAWATGGHLPLELRMPIEVEGYESRRYRK